VSGRARTLCVRRGALGDTLLMVGVLRALRRAHPDRELWLVGVAEHVALLQHLGVVDRASSSEDLAAWSLRVGTLPAWTRDVALVVADDPAFAALASGHVEVLCFDPRVREAPLRPLPLQLAAQLGLALRWPHDGWLTDGAAGSARAAGRPVVVAPGGGGVAKCWPRERWLSLAAALAARGERVEVLVGPVEVERDDPRRWPWPVPVTFAAELALPAVAERLRGAGTFVGNDSGTTHLAAMLGVPTVALFGGGEPDVFAPNGPCVRVLLAPQRDLPRLTVDGALAALDELLAGPLDRPLAVDQGSRARTRSQ
jgi:heptosyltransferase-3